MNRFAFVCFRNISIPYAGNTVIHLDQALARMREYERMKTEAESNTSVRCTCRIIEDEDGAAATTTVSNLEGMCVLEFINSKNHSSTYKKLKAPSDV